MFSESIRNRSVLLDNISASGSKYQVGFNNISRSSQETSTSLINPDELMKLEFSRIIVMNQGMPPYKGKKVVYYEDPRFKTKAFMKLPEHKWFMKQLKGLPSAKKMNALMANQKSIRETIKDDIQSEIKKVEAIEVSRIISSDWNPLQES